MKAVWEELRDSAPDGLLGEIDRPLVEVYCTTVVVCEELTGKLHKNGKPAAERARLLTQLAAMARLLIKLSGGLLISPEARARVTTPAPLKPKNDWGEVG
jgi:phage terminase small subunit